MEQKLRWKGIITVAIPDSPSYSTVPTTGTLDHQRHICHSDSDGEVGKNLSSGHFPTNLGKWKKDKRIEICWA